jgi:hypothetical protein
MKKFILPFLILISLTNCELLEEAEPEVEVNRFSITPSTTDGRPNNYLGCIEINSRFTEIEVWDHGTIDGDIITLVANGERILSRYELGGPSNKKRVSYDFSANGFNYLVLKAENEGSIPPNTAAIRVNGKEFVLQANLQTNGYVDIVVTGYDVFCGSGGNTGSGNTGSGNTGSGNTGSGNTGGSTSNTGDLTVWTKSDLGCGFITFNLNGNGSKTIDSFYSAGLTSCNAAGSANYNGLTKGTYSYTATCTDKSWSGNITIEEGCNRLQLTN